MNFNELTQVIFFKKSLYTPFNSNFKYWCINFTTLLILLTFFWNQALETKRATAITIVSL